MDKHSVIGIDLAKRSIQVFLVNTCSNKVIKNKAVSGNKFLEYLSIAVIYLVKINHQHNVMNLINLHTK